MRKVCPQCSQGRKKSNEKCLSVSDDGNGGQVWYCHHCGYSDGTKTGDPSKIWQKGVKALYSKPTEKLSELKLDHFSFFEGRSITEDVLERNFVSEKAGAIAFPYRMHGEVVNIKYRDIKEKKFWQSKNGRKVVYGYDDIEENSVIITEGEMDKLSFEVAGFQSTVSVPDGAPSPEAKNFHSKFDFLKSCEEKFKAVKRFILATDGDAPGVRLKEELARRLGFERCAYIEWPEGCKDANEVLVKMGVEALQECVEFAVDYPVKGITSPADLPLEEYMLSEDEDGVSTGWASIDRVFTLSPSVGQLHIITGVPSHGKSEWFDALMVNTAMGEGWGYAIFSPENYPLKKHAAKLIEKYTGKTFRSTFNGYDKLTVEELRGAQYWLASKFDFILPENDVFTLEGILSLAKVLVYRKGIKGVVIDPWNEIDHERDGGLSETEYISKCLTRLRHFARNNCCHVFVVAHPAKMYRDKKTGERPVPTPYDISGSAHWYNKADSCIAVWRDVTAWDDDNISMEDKKSVDIHVQKVRDKGLGRPGTVTLKYEYATGRYYE